MKKPPEGGFQPKMLIRWPPPFNSLHTVVNYSTATTVLQASSVPTTINSL